jgi:hypothetical protein
VHTIYDISFFSKLLLLPLQTVGHFGFSRYMIFAIHMYVHYVYSSIHIAKSMYLEKPKRPTICNGGSTCLCKLEVRRFMQNLARRLKILLQKPQNTWSSCRITHQAHWKPIFFHLSSTWESKRFYLLSRYIISVYYDAVSLLNALFIFFALWLLDMLWQCDLVLFDKKLMKMLLTTFCKFIDASYTLPIS